MNYYRVTITDGPYEPVVYNERASRIGLAADRALTQFLKHKGYSGRTIAPHTELRVDVRRIG